MIPIKREAELAKMRVAGRVTAIICGKIARSIFPGVTTRDIDLYAEKLFQDHGVRSAFLGYRGYPGHICVSVNEEVVHGVPGDRRILLGDLVSLDVGVAVDGYHGDMATTVMVGVTDPARINLVSVTEKALKAGLAQARAGQRLSDISNAIERTAVAAGYSVVREFVGHGIGRAMHEDPQVPNFGPPGKGPRLKSGMTLAIEPMVNLGRAEVEVMGDGWTVVTRDRMPSAHVEHTVAITETGCEILTCEGE